MIQPTHSAHQYIPFKALFQMSIKSAVAAAALGKPAAVGGNPVAVGGIPVAVGGNPVAVVDNPVAAEVDTPVAVGNPVAVGDNPVAVGDNPVAVGGILVAVGDNPVEGGSHRVHSASVWAPSGYIPGSVLPDQHRDWPSGS